MNKILLCSVVSIVVMGGVSAVNAEPLRKCTFYEIMNDEDEDGLVQDPKDGPSVCQYTQQDLAAAKQQPTRPGGTVRAAVTVPPTTPVAEPAKPLNEAAAQISPLN